MGIATLLDAGDARALTASGDQPPVVDAPELVNGAEGQTISFLATASDPDGDAISSITAAFLPAGATFTPSESKTSGTFEWTPDFSQAGQYQVTISAQSACRAVTISDIVYTSCVAGGTIATIEVADVDQSPVVFTPPSVAADEGSLVAFSVGAGDPDGSAIASLAAGPLPAGATFTVLADNATGDFSWTTAYGDAGLYSVTFTASNVLAASATTEIEVRPGPDRPPLVASPESVGGAEGSLLTFTATAADPDGQEIESLAAASLPAGATFTAGAPPASGTFAWTPDFTQAGSHSILLSAESACRPTNVSGVVVCARGTATTTITIANTNRAPTAIAGGPYSGIAGVPIAFDGGASSDPDGDPLGYAWDFGDGHAGTGALASHVYAAGGSFTVTLTVDDGAASNATVTTASVEGVFAAAAFVTNANQVIRLASGKPAWCAQIEPVDGSYENSAVVLASLSLSYGGVRIASLPDKTSAGDDKDRNGVQELTACFAKEDLRTLFAGLPRGTSVVDVALEGDLVTGGNLHADLAVSVAAAGPALASSLSPNPMNPEAVLTFVTARAGWARVTLFDINGRLVRRLLEDGSLEAGYHDVRVDGSAESGARLPSGVYFYRVETPEGASVGRVVIAK